MNPNADVEFKEVFETINDVSLFLSLTKTNNLVDSDIEKIFFKSHYIEQFIGLLKIRNFTDVFETKAKQYFEIKGNITIPVVTTMEYYSDEVLTKILTLQISHHLTSIGIKQYLNYCSYKRFEDVIKKLIEFRILFVEISNQLKEILPPSELERILLVECWKKIINSGEEGLEAVRSVFKNMFIDNECVETLIGVLCLELPDDHKKIQGILVNSIASEFCNKTYLSSWKVLLESMQLELILEKFSNLSSAVLSIVEILGNEIKFNPENQKWELISLPSLGYNGFIRVLQSLSTIKLLHFKLKKLIYTNKIKGNVEIWEHIEKDFEHNNT